MGTIKDVYSLPHIKDISNYLNGVVWFTVLDLRSRYWKVEMDECFKPFTMLTVSLLDIYECDEMPFGSPNAPATLQRLMESCAGQIQLNLCLIY